MLEGQFKTAWKCSAHRSRILDLSVMMLFPSAESSGDEPDGWGPYTDFRDG